MGFYTVPMLLDWLGDSVTYRHLGSCPPSPSEGIRLLERDRELLRSDCLYIGDPEAVRNAILDGRIPAEGALVLSSGSGRPVSEVCTLPDALTLAETSLPLLTLYNRVQEQAHRFRLWDDALRRVIYTNGGLQKLLERAAELLHATILLLNNGYKHIAAVYDPAVRDPTSDELRENGFQTIETIHAIRRETPVRQGKQKEFVEYISRRSGNYTIVQLIRYQGNLAARLCVILNGPQPDPAASDLTAILADYVREYMFSHQGVDYGNNSAFGALVADLIERRLTDPDALEGRLRQIRLAVRRYYHVMLISFNDSRHGGEGGHPLELHHQSAGVHLPLQQHHHLPGGHPPSHPQDQTGQPPYL